MVSQYKRSQMLVIFRALNNITAHRLLTACRGVPLDHYRHQTINNFKKLLEQKDAENISKVATPILLIIGMHIGPTKLLEIGPPNAEYNSEGRFCERCTGADWGNDSEIEEAMAADNNEDDNEEDS